MLKKPDLWLLSRLWKSFSQQNEPDTEEADILLDTYIFAHADRGCPACKQHLASGGQEPMCDEAFQHMLNLRGV